VRYRIELSQTQREEFKALLGGGRHAARKLKRAQILLTADAGASDEEIARSVGVSDPHMLHLMKQWIVVPVEEEDGR
jgi:hypothetical protein